VCVCVCEHAAVLIHLNTCVICRTYIIIVIARYRMMAAAAPPVDRLTRNNNSSPRLLDDDPTINTRIRTSDNIVVARIQHNDRIIHRACVRHA